MTMPIKEIDDIFRFNVKYYREKKNWTQRDLSIQADYSTGAIGSLEAGSSKPSFDMIVKIANALDVHPALLFISESELIELAQKNVTLTDREFLQKLENELRSYLAEK